MGLKRTLWLAAGLTLAAGMAWGQNAGGGAAGSWGGGSGDSALEEMCGYLMTLWTWARAITYTMAIIGLLFIAIRAFGGKFEWSRLIWFGVVLFLFSSTPFLLAFLTSGQVSDVQCGLSYNGPAVGPQ
jgi:hypothetical protein